MSRSQNATFSGAEPEPDGSRIPGESIAGLFASSLSSDGWSIGDIDNWRDSGFYLPVDRDGQSLQIVLAPYHDSANRWILQLAPQRLPSLILSWFGATPSATPETVHALATDVHHILTAAGFTEILWCWDDLADHDDCTPFPVPASGAAGGGA